MSTLLCRICLRSVKGNKDCDENLVLFFEEICDFDVSESPILSFCAVCKHLLRRFYNFRQKCQRAQKILKTKRTELKKKTIENLHKLMPLDSLGLLIPGARQGVFSYNPDVKPLLKNLSLQIQMVAEASELDEKPIKVEYDTDSNLVVLNATSDTEDESKPDLASLQANDNADNLEEVTALENSLIDHTIDFKGTTLEVFGDSDLDADDPFLKIGCVKKKVVGKTKKTDYHKFDGDTQEQVLKLCKSKSETANTSLEHNMLTVEELKFLSKRETNSEKRINRIRRLVLQLKEKMLQRIDEGNLDLGEDVTWTKEQYLEMYAKCDKSRLSRLGLLKPDNGEPVRIKKLLLHLIRRYSPEYETVFDIQQLTTQDSKLAEFHARKNYKQYLTAEFKCDKCYRGFTAQCMLDYHNKWHDPVRQHACDICSMRFPLRKTLKLHQSGNHSSVYRCKLCDVLTYNFEAMFNHYQQHKGVTYSCDTCLSEFRSRSALNTHRATHTAHKCAHCLHRFMTSARLDCHMKLKHPNAPPPADEGSERESCVKCAVTESRDPGMPCGHKQTRKKIVRFKCHVIDCQLHFKTAVELRQHILETGHVRRSRQRPGLDKLVWYKQRTNIPKKKKRNTLPDKPYRTCPICQEEVPNKFSRALYKHHQDKHPSVPYTHVNERNHLCEQCGKSFLVRSVYLDHLNVHSGERPYACSECQSRYSTRHRLLLHKERHGPPRYECDYCGKKFLSSANLFMHRRTHIGDRCFKCEICGKGFLHAGALKEHVKGVHNQVRRAKKTTRKITNKLSSAS